MSSWKICGFCLTFLHFVTASFDFNYTIYNVNKDRDAGIISVSENSEIGTTIGFFQMKMIPSTFQEGEEFEFFGNVDGMKFRTIKINFTTTEAFYKIILAKRLDRELTTQITTFLNLCVSSKLNIEGRENLHCKIERLLIRLVDENDNTPMFPRSSYKFKIYEGAPAGSIVGVIRAVDRDAGNNAMIMYSLLDSDDLALSRSFSIDRNTGEIFTIMRLDFEQIKLYEGLVIARDNGFVQRSATAEVKVEIIDINDNAPVFSKSMFNFSVTENGQIGQNVGQIRAQDADFGTNGMISFTIIPNLEKHLFIIEKIDNNTANIKTNSVFDREEIYSISFQIVARDNGNPPLSTQTTVLVQILDENDNLPIILGNEPTLFFTVPNNPSNGNIIGVVQAIDVDEGRNGELSFRIEPQSSPIPFEIDSSKGEIGVSGDLDSPSYTFTVIVEDLGTPRHQTSTSVSVAVESP